MNWMTNISSAVFKTTGGAAAVTTAGTSSGEHMYGATSGTTTDGATAGTTAGTTTGTTGGTAGGATGGAAVLCACSRGDFQKPRWLQALHVSSVSVGHGIFTSGSDAPLLLCVWLCNNRWSNSWNNSWKSGWKNTGNNK